jgi:hypothetical protein
MFKQVLSDKIKVLVEYFNSLYSPLQPDSPLIGRIMAKRLCKFVIIGHRPHLLIQ